LARNAMPDLLAHYAVSYLVARSRLDFKRALFIALISLLPDIDALLRIHRWLTHSLIVVLIIAIPLLLLVHWRFKKHFELATIAVLIYALHLVLDLFTGPTPVFWPLHDSVCVRVELTGSVRTDGVTLTPEITIITKTPDFTRRQIVEGPLVSEVGVMLAIVIVIMILLEALKSKRTLLK